MVLDVLGEILLRVGEEGFWVLVSVGIGLIYLRVFSLRYGEDVRGLLMIDLFYEDLFLRVGDLGCGFLFWLRGVILLCGIDRIFGVLFRGRCFVDWVWGCVLY